jgi:hypothetical protein
MRRQQPVVFFTKTDDIALLNKVVILVASSLTLHSQAVTYIFDNEITSYIKVFRLLC